MDSLENKEKKKKRKKQDYYLHQQVSPSLKKRFMKSLCECRHEAVALSNLRELV